MNFRTFLPALALALLSPVALAESDALHYLQRQWAIANYQLEGDAREDALEKLMAEADSAVQQAPNDAELHIWSGIIKSSYAGARGGLGALKFAKASKAELEKALELDDKALAGSAYTSLGTLYFKVPGWPLGFGDDEKAEQLLKQALALNPDGIDPNYFYAEFLREEGNYRAAEQFLLAAQKAPARPGRELADEGRQREISAALSEVRKHL